MSGHRDGDADPLLGRSLDDRYRIEARVGRGGMGAVYRGRHLMMDRAVAIKVLRPDLAEDQVAIRRFAREAKGTFRFDHPNCVRVFDFGFAADLGVLYLIMEYLDGRTVGDEVRVDGPIAPARVAHVAAQVVKALAHAHGLGVVHRDLKPDNVMLVTRDGDVDFAKVLDFGLAKLYEPDSSGTQIFSLAAITQDGMVFGTPEYMSPEQATGSALSPVSDFYSLGVVMYEMVTGLLPFKGKSFMAVLSKQVREPPIAPSARRPELGIPGELDQLIMDCLQKAPEKRPQTAADLGERLAAAEAAARAMPARVPVELAASETMDLSAQYPRVDAASRSHSQVATAPTIAAGTASTHGVSSWAKKRPSRARLAIAMLVPVLAIGGILSAIAVFSGGPPSRVDAGPASRAKPAQSPARDLSARNRDARVSSVPPDAGPSPADARALDATAPAPAGDDRAPRADKRQQLRARVAAHVRAANSARKAGNTLKQIAEADSALRLDPTSTRAAYLLGDALLQSGDKARGCRYLQKARRLPEAREQLRKADCK